MNSAQTSDLKVFNAVSSLGSISAESLFPSQVYFMHPDEVAEDPLLTQAQKREILASWASDIHAVRGAPALRRLGNGPIVHIDHVLEALRSLDEREDVGKSPSGPSHRLAGLDLGLRTKSKPALPRRRSDDDDDDPPPCPAMAAGPLGSPLSGGATADPGLLVAA